MYEEGSPRERGVPPSEAGAWQQSLWSPRERGVPDTSSDYRYHNR
ncbi:hypothetical protein ABMX48_24815 [Streptomyces cavourensis]